MKAKPINISLQKGIVTVLLACVDTHVGWLQRIMYAFVATWTCVIDSKALLTVEGLLFCVELLEHSDSVL